MFKALLSIVLISLLSGCASTPDKPTGDPETRVVEYLQKNVTPGKPVLVTELYSNVFTTPEEQEAVKKLYDTVFQIPAFVAMQQQETGKIPSIQDISTHFNYKVPGTAQALLRVLDADPRIPPFFMRDRATGEITAVDVDAIRNTERFRDALLNRK